MFSSKAQNRRKKATTKQLLRLKCRKHKRSKDELKVVAKQHEAQLQNGVAYIKKRVRQKYEMPGPENGYQICKFEMNKNI